MVDPILILVFTYIIPPLMAFGGIILIASGVMDNRHVITIMGIAAFFGAAALPFIVLPSIIA
ncbi:MAG: hypothetical protein ACLQG5_12865 [Methanobacterium sp.]|jgi:hypothetical protein